MALPEGQEPCLWVEVRFKNGRKDYYYNAHQLHFYVGNPVVVETGTGGYDIGSVSLTGELVRVQMRKKAVAEDPAPRKLLRKATDRDMEKWEAARAKETEWMHACRAMAVQHGLNMKVSDVEAQGDGFKAFFYYTADERVDFRQLVRDLSASLGIRVEMRHIGARQEAGRLGGLGICGRELCCSTWLTDFRAVSTSAARYQSLSLNPQKLAGQCGKLKCCLNFELDQYAEAMSIFPEGKKIKTDKGEADLQKMDILRGMMWFAYREDRATWIALKAEDAKAMMDLNAKGEKPAALEDKQVVEHRVKADDFVEIVAPTEDSLTRFDKPKKKNRSFKKRGNRPPQNKP
jgi:cell fate regulator YaaT (PSP1 superfamily)